MLPAGLKIFADEGGETDGVVRHGGGDLERHFRRAS